MTCDIPLDVPDFGKIMYALRSHGWEGVQAEAENQARKLIVSGGLDLPAEEVLRRSVFSEAIGAAEVFFRDGCIYYAQLVNPTTPRVSISDFDDLMYAVSSTRRRVQGRSEDRKVFEIGLVSNGDGDLTGKLKILAEAIERAAADSLDGRRVRHFNFLWTDREPQRSRLEGLKERFAGEGIELGIAQPVMNPVKEEAAAVLENDGNRALLLELKNAVFAREADVLARRGNKQEETKESLELLKKSGLVKSEHLLQCKKTSALLIRVDSLEELKVPAVAQLSCAGCSRKFADELTSEGYSVSALGRELSNGSHWMTLWVTRRLVEAGIPLGSIAWNLEESGEEVDIMVDFMGELWLIELKDREFGAGDAHPFNYRTVRYRSNRSFIISTDKVSPDAKKVFAELSRAAPNRRVGQSQPVYIEGLDKTATKFREEVRRLSTVRANTLLRIPEMLTGYNLSAALR
ncbi:hypothetical protein AB0907_39555 [Streptomyces sp. NPDC006975]|uniref:hypothetical protein n=1 Tax=Streptomyces sp. NPDC006975 TaxID=3154310 RepID=UPI0034541232